MTATNNDKAIVPTVEAGVINAVAQGCWQTSQNHGFHEDWDAANWLEGLADYLSKESRFTDDQTWFPYLISVNEHAGDPSVPEGVKPISTVEALRETAKILRTNVLGMKIALIHSEMSEALEALRTLGAEGLLQPRDFNVDIKEADNWAEELADAKVRLDDLSGMTKVAIGDVQIAKMAVNEGRPHKHGRKA